ncbi:MAG: hypothetical protein ABSF29_10140 [Tepidisphaeraceae bacterium]|jgi:hypothetical protein
MSGQLLGYLRPTIAPAITLTRIAIILLGLALWFWTQTLLARRKPLTNGTADGGRIGDGIHFLTAKINRDLNQHPKKADALLISSSLVIDLLGFYLLASAIFGSTIEPYLGLLMLFALRQFCQAFCPLPPPPGMIWRSPGFPAILVTYRTSSDLFFSGHTAIAVYGAATLASAFGWIGIALGCAIVLFEAGAVLVLRAHYTMDVFAGIVTALYVHRLAISFAPSVDQWIAHAAKMVHG